jgi:limonene-1,2-epoxide hydrolase
MTFEVDDVLFRLLERVAYGVDDVLFRLLVCGTFEVDDVHVVNLKGPIH